MIRFIKKGITSLIEWQSPRPVKAEPQTAVPDEDKTPEEPPPNFDTAAQDNLRYDASYDPTFESDKYFAPHRRDDGSFTFRILPPDYETALLEELPEKPPLWFVPAQLHMLDRQQVLCGKEYTDGKFKGECDICNYYSLLWKLHEKHSQRDQSHEARQFSDTARDIKPFERYYYNIVLPDEGQRFAKIWAAGKLVHKQVCDCVERSVRKGENPFNVLGAHDFLCYMKKMGSGGFPFPTYTISLSDDFCRLGDNKSIEMWMATRRNLEEFVARLRKSPEERRQLLVESVKKADRLPGIRLCRMCELPFEPQNSQQITCSSDCYEKAEKKWTPPCPLCGCNLFKKLMSDSGREYRKYTCGFAYFRGLGQTDEIDYYERCGTNKVCSCDPDRIMTFPQGCKNHCKQKIVNSTTPMAFSAEKV